jgi:hypothetical protein
MYNRRMPVVTNTRWLLPGAFAPYLIVCWHDKAARDTERRVSAQTALQQLENWARFHAKSLQEMDEALKENQSSGLLTSAVGGLSQSLKLRISSAIQAGRLVVLQASQADLKQTPSSGNFPNLLTAQLSLTAGAAALKRKVTFKLDLTVDKGLSLPYAIAVNGVVVEHAVRPGFLKQKKDAKGKRVDEESHMCSIMVDAGSTVSLYLNSDAHASHRKNPVYGVTPNDRDVFVRITEKVGKHPDTAVPTFVSTKGPKGKEVDYYAASLTGDIWMKVSYKYTEADAKSHLPVTTDPGIRSAVLAIYREELKQKSLAVTCSGQGASTNQTITLSFTDSDNPKNNINNFSLLTDGLTRVHPKGFLALLEAARTAGVKKMTLSSNWRPLLGSIAHRSGLGVDVSSIEDATQEVQMNRQELRKSTAPDVAAVSAKEKELFGKYETAKTAASTAQTRLAKAEKELAAAMKAVAAAQKEKAKAKNDEARLKAATEKEALAIAARDAALKQRELAMETRETASTQVGTTRTAWNNELDANEPACIRSLRQALMTHTMVRQVLDPWYMDTNTKDKTAAVANEQCTSLETLHAHHLHITISEPDILLS